jgi:hypothetical protein
MVRRSPARAARLRDAGAVLRIALKQTLVFAQGVFDLAVARQGGIIVDTEAMRGFEFRLMKVADAAFRDESCGLMRNAMTAFAGFGLGVLVCVVHGQRPGGARG